MASRTTPADVNLTFYTTGVLPSMVPGTNIVGTAGQYQVWSDRAVWDTTNNVFIPCTYNAGIAANAVNPYLLFGD